MKHHFRTIKITESAYRSLHLVVARTGEKLYIDHEARVYPAVGGTPATRLVFHRDNLAEWTRLR